MGAGKLLDTGNENIKEYVQRVGEIILLISYLDRNIQMFIEAILNFRYEYKSKITVTSLTRSFELSKRVDFLKVAIKEKHNNKLNEYLKLHKEIIECNRIRNELAHSQVYFHVENDMSIMMISNLKKIEVNSPKDFFKKVSIIELNSTIKRFRSLITNFNSFTYGLGYFQGHNAE
jgi:hypothetical protein